MIAGFQQRTRATLPDHVQVRPTRCGFQPIARGYVLRAVLATAAILFTAPFSQAQGTQPQSADPFLNEARDYVLESQPDRARYRLREQSLLNWTNPIRQKERGAMYVWLHGQRPAAIGTLFTYEMNGKIYSKHELHSLAATPFRATFEGQLAWTPDKPGLVWKDLPESPQPGPTHVSRALQMRQIARQFRTELVDPKLGRSELRLAPRPLFEYAAPEAGVVDGAVLAYVFATDPEVLLLLEAYDETQNDMPRRGFRFAFARCHHWQVIAYHGEDRVWEAALDLSHEGNNLGDKANMSKIYNSFHPRPGVTQPATGESP